MRRSLTAGSGMSTGSKVEGLEVERDSLKSDARMRKRAVWVSAVRGMEERWEERKLESQVGETGRELVVRRCVAMCSWWLAEEDMVWGGFRGRLVSSVYLLVIEDIDFFVQSSD